MSSLESVARRMTLFLQVYRFAVPLLSLTRLFLYESAPDLTNSDSRNPVVNSMVEIVFAVITFFLATWSAEWIKRSSHAVLHGLHGDGKRIETLSNTLNNWNTVWQWSLALLGALGIVWLVTVAWATSPLLLGWGLILIPLVYIGFVVLGWFKSWLEDATMTAWRGATAPGLQALSDTLRRWYLAAFVLGVVGLTSTLISNVLDFNGGFLETAITLVLSALSIALTWLWREYFGAFTNHVVDRPTLQTTKVEQA